MATGHPAPGERRPAGWYQDPWSASRRRWWTGEAWTFWTTEGSSAPVISPVPAAASGPAEPPPPPPPRSFLERRWPVLVVAALVVGMVAGALVLRRSPSHTINGASGTTIPSEVPTLGPSTSVEPRDPSASVLSSLVVRQTDVPSSFSVQQLANGNSVSDPTLDLCNGTFPSEAMRTARLQVVVLDGQGDGSLSTEAVLYGKPANADQAFAELQSVAAKCPATPVTSPVGEPSVTTHFNTAPDGSWPQTPTVDRLAFDFTTVDALGQSGHSIAVYLKRGRVLMGVYFPQPDGDQTPVAGKTAIPDIVGIFATRIAGLPASVVNG
ncbi:MAG: hypothetical protein ABR511_12775 [Acidimicrobiales bacterium]